MVNMFAEGRLNTNPLLFGPVISAMLLFSSMKLSFEMKVSTVNS